MIADKFLEEAWTLVAPNRAAGPFPRGFWQDLARVAVHLALDEPLDFRPTQCLIGSRPEPPQRVGSKRGGKISAATRAENTAKLLAALREQNP